MRGFFGKIARALGWLVAAEFAMPAILAALLLVVAPLLCVLLFLSHRPLPRRRVQRQPLDSGCHSLHPRCASSTVRLGERDTGRVMVGHDVNCVMEA